MIHVPFAVTEMSVYLQYRYRRPPSFCFIGDLTYPVFTENVFIACMMEANCKFRLKGSYDTHVTANDTHVRQFIICKYGSLDFCNAILYE